MKYKVGFRINTNKFKLHPSLLVMCLILMICLVSLTQAIRYNRDNYNCLNMSKDCAKVFVGLGIPTELVHGECKTDDTSHCWVRLWGWLNFESTILFPTFWFNNRYEVYKIEKLN